MKFLKHPCEDSHLTEVTALTVSHLKKYMAVGYIRSQNDKGSAYIVIHKVDKGGQRAKIAVKINLNDASNSGPVPGVGEGVGGLLGSGN